MGRRLMQMDADWVERPPQKLRVGGIVLCGGESRRMGTSKAWLPFGGETLLQHIASVLAQASSPVVLATRRGMDLPPLSSELRIVYDEIENGGPLAGMAAGMIALKGDCDAALVTACDHPFVRAAVFHRMIDLLGDHGAVVLERAGRLFPTLALYRLSKLETLEGLLSSGQFRAQDFARHCDPRCIGAAEFADIDPDMKSLCNMNSLADYEAAMISADSTSSKGQPCER